MVVVSLSVKGRFLKISWMGGCNWGLFYWSGFSGLGIIGVFWLVKLILTRQSILMKPSA